MNSEHKPSLLGHLGALWGVIGITYLLGNAIFKVGSIAWAGLHGNHLSLWHWIGAGVWLAFMLVAEGYRGFQKKFAPRVAARARYLRQNPRLLHVVLAPFFCIGYFHGTRRRMITSWTISLIIVGVIWGVSHLSQPWRGLLDLGVVAGLSWGLVSVWCFCAKALLGSQFSYDPEVPLQH